MAVARNGYLVSLQYRIQCWLWLHEGRQIPSRPGPASVGRLGRKNMEVDSVGRYWYSAGRSAPLLLTHVIANESVHSWLDRMEAGWRFDLARTAAAGRTAAQRCRPVLPGPSAAVRIHMPVVAAAIVCIFPSRSEMYRQQFHGLLDHPHLCSARIPLHKQGRLVGSTCLGGEVDEFNCAQKV
jgi:hypothetical protein